jgi:hypothetical protein
MSLIRRLSKGPIHARVEAETAFMICSPRAGYHSAVNLSGQGNGQFEFIERQPDLQRSLTTANVAAAGGDM